MKKALFVIETILSFGLNLLIARWRKDPRVGMLIWGLIALNEVRGGFVVYELLSRGIVSL